VKEGLREIVGGGYGNVCGGVAWHDDGGWKPREGVGQPFCGGGPCPDTVTTIVAESWTEISAFDGMMSPGFAHVGLLVDGNFGSGRGEEIAVKIKSAMHVGLGGYLGVDPRTA
jgi:hypothetical protein